MLILVLSLILYIVGLPPFLLLLNHPFLFLYFLFHSPFHLLSAGPKGGGREGGEREKGKGRGKGKGKGKGERKGGRKEGGSVRIWTLVEKRGRNTNGKCK